MLEKTTNDLGADFFMTKQRNPLNNKCSIYIFKIPTVTLPQYFPLSEQKFKKNQEVLILKHLNFFLSNKTQNY